MKRIIVTSGIVGGTSYYLWNEKLNKVNPPTTVTDAAVTTIQLAQAGFRILRLINTTVSIVTDYKYTIWKYQKINSNSQYAQAKVKLRDLQGNEEKLTFDLWAATADKDYKQQNILKAAILENKKNIEAIAEEMSKLASTSYLSGTHTRSAIKLRDMCVANKGVYIKLGNNTR
jgi:hypothetical protein